MATALPKSLESQEGPEQEPTRTEQITSIIEEEFPSYEKTAFCYEIVKRTLNALLSHRYSEFDAQTTSNCCHGIALLVKELISKSQQEDLKAWFDLITKKIDHKEIDLSLKIPQPLVELSQLYILTYIRTICPVKGLRTSPLNLKEISPLGRNYSHSLVRSLQRKFSNQVALTYQTYALNSPSFAETCGIPTRLWGKYVSSKHLRNSTQNISFASCLFSMQVSLAHLILSKSKIAVVNDIYNSKEKKSERHIKLFQGNGTNGFELVNLNSNIHIHSKFEEPVVVFSGSSYSNTPDAIKQKMDEWTDRIPNLMLACDTFYPQFPNSCDDATFGKDPITPDEIILQRAIDLHKNIDGVSSCDPTFFCLNHIYPCSLRQIASNDLSSHKIPIALLNSTSTPSQ